MSQLAADHRLVVAAARALARIEIDRAAPGVDSTIWRHLSPETRRGYQDKAVEILVAIDIERERLYE